MAKTKQKSKAPKTDAPDGEVIVAFKGFDKDLKCRGYQYEVGKTYTHDGDVAICNSGFHACTDPIDVWRYYGPANSRFAMVEMSGALARHADDSKLASASITIKAELSLPEFIGRAVDCILSRVDWNGAKETNTGYYSAATNTGNYSAATNTGDRSAATNTGYYSAATNTGDRSAAKVEGQHSVAISAGYEGRVCGADGCALFAVERNDNYEITSIASGIVGRDGIKADTWYVARAGKLVEWSE